MTALPRHIAATRSRSVSKPTQCPLPRFRMSPRGVRFFVGKPGPARPASSTDEKKGKSGSIHSAQGWRAAAGRDAPGDQPAHQRHDDHGQRPAGGISSPSFYNRPPCLDSQDPLSRGVRSFAPCVPHPCCRSSRAAGALDRARDRRCAGGRRLPPDRHPHRLGRPPVRGVPLSGAVPVRRTIGRSRDDPQRELPRAHDGRCDGGKTRGGSAR